MGFSSTKIRATQIIITLSLLASCANGAIDLPADNVPSSNLWYQYKNDEWGLSLSVPEHFSSTLDNEGMFFGYGPAYGDFYIQVYKPDPPPFCSPEFIGEPPVTALGVMKPTIDKDEEGNIRVWGKVDYWGPYGHGYALEPEPICSPGYGEGAGYAFCSQKGEKAVTICISQQTDNAKLAEEIFKSFRWTE